MRHTIIKEHYEELAFVNIATVERDGINVYDIQMSFNAEALSHQGGDLVVLLNLTHNDLVEIQSKIAKFLYEGEQRMAGLL